MDQYLLFVFLAPGTAIVLIVLSIYLFRFSNTPGAGILAVHRLLIAGWLFCDTLELVFASPAISLVFAKLSFFFIALVPVSWLAFSLEYCGFLRWLRFPRVLFLLVFPLFTNLIVWLQDSWLWTAIHFTVDSNFMVLHVEYSWWFWVHLVTSYGMGLAGIWLIFTKYLKLHHAYRKQSVLLLIAALFPFATNIATMLDLFPGFTKDYSPLGFAFAGLVMAYGIFKYYLFEIVPIPRNVALDYMEDGMLVVDHDDQIVDSNRAARVVLGQPGNLLFHQPVQTFFPDWGSWLKNTSREEPGVFAAHFGKRHYEVKVSLFWDARKRKAAKLLILHDVTEYLQLLSMVHKYAITDPLLDMFNRRHFKDLAEGALEKACQAHEPLALILIDIDRFKLINDTYGHRAGDEVLKALGNFCQKFIRPQDILARYGGEEFVILLPNVDAFQAHSIGDRLRCGIDGLLVPTSAGPVSIKISMGVAGYDPSTAMSFDDLVERADQALYKAKQYGRNQVSVWEEE